MVRWVPHQKMVADVDPARGNDALNQFLRSGWLSLVDVHEELLNRKTDGNFRKRSHRASQQRLSAEYEEQGHAFFAELWWKLANLVWGEL